jgi:hypothetical protein
MVRHVTWRTNFNQIPMAIKQSNKQCLARQTVGGVVVHAAKASVFAQRHLTSKNSLTHILTHSHVLRR